MRRIVTSAALAVLSTTLSLAVAAAAPTAPGKSATAMTGATTAPTHANTMASAQKATQPTDTTTLRGPAKTGQPNKSCEDLGNQPGHSMSAPGSAFNPEGKAGSVYAGEQPQNSRNTASVSQYDTACARPSR
jgi:hypothetical protein